MEENKNTQTNIIEKKPYFDLFQFLATVEILSLISLFVFFVNNFGGDGNTKNLGTMNIWAGLQVAFGLFCFIFGFKQSGNSLVISSVICLIIMFLFLILIG